MTDVRGIEINDLVGEIEEIQLEDFELDEELMEEEMPEAEDGGE